MSKKAHPGCPVMVNRGLYWHHGLYVGDGLVIDYSDPSGKVSGDAKVRHTAWAEFADGSPIYVNESLKRHAAFAPQEAMSRAQGRLDERRFNLLHNNCEHFVSWCLRGRSKSAQVQNALEAASVAALVLIIGAIAARA